jgi:hypothetical protein
LWTARQGRQARDVGPSWWVIARREPRNRPARHRADSAGRTRSRGPSRRAASQTPRSRQPLCGPPAQLPGWPSRPLRPARAAISRIGWMDRRWAGHVRVAQRRVGGPPVSARRSIRSAFARNFSLGVSGPDLTDGAAGVVGHEADGLADPTARPGPARSGVNRRLPRAAHLIKYGSPREQGGR